ncbi:MAG TPA: hypothetical protein ENK85_03470 [Saprospiraceae bacterium]|nr:hypothetical protein [Saprospiraceae bacterium]
MKREFLINVVLVIGLNVLVKVFFIFGIDRGVQNLVGPAAYGAYFAILNLAYLFQIINDFGIQNFNNKHIAQHRQLLPKYLPNILVFKAILGIIFMMIFLFFGWVLGYWALSKSVLIAIGLNQILVALIYYLRSNVSALGFYRLDSVFSVLDKFLMIIIIGTLLWTPSFRTNFTMEWFAWGQFISLFLTTLIGLFFLYRKVKIPRIRLNLPFLLVIIKESGPYALLGLLMAIYSRIDSVMLSQLVSEHETGIYASAFRLMDAGTMVGLLISAFLLPMFVRQIKMREPTEDLAQLVIKMMWVVGVTAAIPVIIFREPIMKMLYTEGDAYSANVLGLLMLALLALMWSSVNGVLLLAAGAIRQLNKMYFWAVLLNLGLNAFIIPTHGAVGAAFVAAITQWFVTLYQYRLLAQSSLYRPSGRAIGQILVFPILSGLISYGLFALSSNWLLLFIGSIAITLILAVVLGLFSPQGLIKLLKNR